MIKNRLLHHWKLILALVLHIGCFVAAWIISPWLSISSFSMFALTFGFLLMVTIFLKFSYVIKFFNVFIYLGFYSKLCSHLIFSYPFNEPIGAFIGHTHEVNEFFYISSVAALAVVIASVCDWYFFRRSSRRLFPEIQEAAIPYFQTHYKLIFGFLVACCIIFSVINIKLGINVSGLAAVTILPSPINALIAFFLTLGFSIVIALYAVNEFKMTGKLKYTWFLVLLEGAFSTVSVVSRGIFLFHFLPFFFCLLFLYREHKYPLKKIIAGGILAGMTFVVTSFLVTKARSALYDGYNLNHRDYMSIRIFDFNQNAGGTGQEAEYEVDSSQNSGLYKDDNRAVVFGRNYGLYKNTHPCGEIYFCNQSVLYAKQMIRLVVDRWIGAEGLMAVVSYPEKNVELIYRSLLRVPKVGEKDIFEMMNRSFYPISSKYVFTSLPGPVAFFYYSGNGLFVFFSMLLFVGLLWLLQHCVEIFFNNIFLSFQTSFYFAISFMQFGISPRPLVIAFLMLFCLLLTLFFSFRFLVYYKQRKALI